MIALLCTLLTALPTGEQYAAKSLPAAIARVLEARDGIYRVQRFPEEARSLWVVTSPCRVPAEEFPLRLAASPAVCRAVLFLGTPHGFREVGRATGELIDADPETGIPEELSFHVSGSKTETQLRWSDGRFVNKQVARWFRDPLTRDRINPDELRARGLLDLQNGRFTVAAGRYALLCQDPCAVLDVETLATALLEARLFDQAEVALRRAVDMPGHQLQDLASLISLLRAEGREKESAVFERRRAEEERALAREPPDAGR